MSKEISRCKSKHKKHDFGVRSQQGNQAGDDDVSEIESN